MCLAKGDTRPEHSRGAGCVIDGEILSDAATSERLARHSGAARPRLLRAGAGSGAERPTALALAAPAGDERLHGLESDLGERTLAQASAICLLASCKSGK